MPRYLKIGAAGEVKPLLQRWSDLPRRADFKVARHLLDRRSAPSSKEGIVVCDVSPPFILRFPLYRAAATDVSVTSTGRFFAVLR
jgi:hypothetical protein